MKYDVNVLDGECCEVFKDVRSIVVITGDDTYVYNNVHRTYVSETIVGGDVIQSRGLYYRNWIEVDGGRQYSSYILEIFKSCVIDIDNDVVTIVANGMLGNGVDHRMLRSWFKPAPKYSSRSRVTKDVAQSRLDELGFDFTISMWENTYKPATVECNQCSSKLMFKRGSNVYSVNDYGGFTGVCSVCQRYKYALENIGKYKSKLMLIEKEFKNAVYNEEEFLQLKLSIENKIEKEKGIVQSYREINPHV